MLRRSDTDSQKRLRNEFNVYLILEEAYQTGKLRDRIAPRCYGAFEGDNMYVLILELCDGILGAWKELNESERRVIFITSDCPHVDMRNLPQTSSIQVGERSS